jgi:hypothetical protein
MRAAFDVWFSQHTIPRIIRFISSGMVGLINPSGGVMSSESPKENREYSNRAVIIPSCLARHCHPETCTCRDNEAAIMDYRPFPNGTTSGVETWQVVKYGLWNDLQNELALSNPQED